MVAVIGRRLWLSYDRARRCVVASIGGAGMAVTR